MNTIQDFNVDLLKLTMYTCSSIQTRELLIAKPTRTDLWSVCTVMSWL